MSQQLNLAKLEDLVDGHWKAKQIELIAEQVAPKASPGELALFLNVAKKRGLDPFAKQIHAVHRWDKRESRHVMSIQVGVDGYRAIAESTGEYVGNDDPVYLEGNGKHPLAATVTVWRMVAGQRCPFTATARWDEYAASGKNGLQPMWARMPYLMLGKCAETLALRKAFPSSLSGLYTDEEMSQADAVDVEVISSRTVQRQPEPAPPAAAPPAPVAEQGPPPGEGILAGEALADVVRELWEQGKQLEAKEDRDKLGAVLQRWEERGTVQEKVIPVWERWIRDRVPVKPEPEAAPPAGELDYPDADPEPAGGES